MWLLVPQQAERLAYKLLTGLAVRWTFRGEDAQDDAAAA
jgi:hypothetical protein